MTRPVLSITDDIGRTAGDIIAQACELAVGHHGYAVLAVPGGGSPKSVFRWLALNLDPQLHEQIVVTFVDERHVPVQPGAPWSALPAESNLRGAWESWFQHRMPRVIPMARPGTLADAVEATAAELRPYGGVDVALLGFGPDGHVASLFPGHPALARTEPVLSLTDSPKPPAERITLSMACLQAAAITVVIGSGDDKAPVAAQAFTQAQQGEATLPLAMAHPRIRWHWVLDPAAASLIANPE